MARAHLKHIVREGSSSRVIQNAAVYVYQDGTTTDVGGMWSAPTGGTALTNPLISNAQGEVEAWLDTAQRVDLKVTDNNDLAYYSGTSQLLSFADFTEDVDALPAPADIEKLSGDNIATGTGTYRDVGTNDGSKGYEFLRLLFNSGIRGTSRDGSADYNVVRVGDWPGIGATQNYIILGDSRLDWLSVPCDLDLVQKDIIDVKRVGNELALTDTWLVQGLSPSGGGASYYVGIQTKTDQNQFATRLIANNAQTVVNSYVKIVNSTFQMADTAAEANPRLKISNGGNVIELGPGGADALDIKLSRAATDILQLEDQFRVRRDATGLTAFAADVTGDTSPRLSISSSGVLAFGPGNAAVDMTISRPGLGRLRCNTKFIADSGLGAGNTIAATTLGSVTRKMEVFDTAGTSLGFVPIYGSIT
jgi:hypothetical protein